MELNLIFSIVFMLILLILLLGLFAVIFYAMIFGAPFAPVAQHRIDTMIKLLKPKKGQKMVDLGSGDGRIVIAFAKLGIESHGYEINPVLAYWSRFKIRRLGLRSKAFIHFGDYWGVNLREFDLVTLYGISHMMGRLEKKLKRELKPGSLVASNYFKFSKWQAITTENKVLIYKQIKN